MFPNSGHLKYWRKFYEPWSWGICNDSLLQLSLLRDKKVFSNLSSPRLCWRHKFLQGFKVPAGKIWGVREFHTQKYEANKMNKLFSIWLPFNCLDLWQFSYYRRDIIYELKLKGKRGCWIGGKCFHVQENLGPGWGNSNLLWWNVIA